MITTATRIEDLTLGITEEIRVRAPLEATFAALLEQLGPFNETAEDKPMPMKLEAWRAAGGTATWVQQRPLLGVVQAIKRPTLLEITGRCSCPIRRVESTVPLERNRWRNTARFSSHALGLILETTKSVAGAGSISMKAFGSGRRRRVCGERRHVSILHRQRSSAAGSLMSAAD